MRNKGDIMRYKVILQRLYEYSNVRKPPHIKLEDSTIGSFVVYDEGNNEIFKCFSLENIGPSTDIPNKDKRIMPRVYSIEWSETSIAVPKKYKNKVGNKNLGKGLLLTCDRELPEFRHRRILIHIGNYPQDTEGCILLGMYKSSKDGVINNSTLAVQTFYDLVAKYGVENFQLEIREIEQ